MSRRLCPKANETEQPAALVPDVDLNLFCRQDGQRPGLACPWTYEGFTYASDAVALLRVGERPDYPPNPAAPNAGAAGLFAEYPPPALTDFCSLPALPLAEGITIVCPDCAGTAPTPRKKGKPVRCKRCRGEKRVSNLKPVVIGERRLATHYLLKLATLPGIRIATNHGKRLDPLRFVFDGGEGLLMPMKS